MKALNMPADRRLDCMRFGGITDSSREGMGCFTRAHNISSRAYPRALSAESRYRVCDLSEGKIYPFVAEKLGWMTSSGELWYGGERVEGWNHTNNSADSHTIVMIGTKAVVFPEKAWFDTESGECGTLAISKRSNIAVVGIDFDDGVGPSEYYYTFSEPTEPKNNTLWVRKDFSDDSFVCYRWYSATEEWVRQDKLLYRVSFDYAGDGINEGDRLEVTACASEETNFDEFLGMHRVNRTVSGLIVFESVPERKLLPRICRAITHSVTLNSFTVERRVPDLCLVGVAGERIWGVDADGSTIRASAPGDPFSWYSFDGYGGDSFLLATAYPGRYTGIGCLDDMPVFFKSDRIIRVKGSRPDNYSVLSLPACGLLSDSPDGICSDGNSLYYRGTGGIWRYDGSVPELAFECEFAGTVRAVCNGRFCYFADEKGFAVYDTQNKVLCTEDGIAERIFCHNGAVWYITHEQGGRALCRIGGDEGSGQRLPDPEWVLESSYFAPTAAFGASPRSFAFDIESDGESAIPLEISRDGEFERVGDFCFKGRMRGEVALPPRKCSVIAYRISGRGFFMLREAAIFTPE